LRAAGERAAAFIRRAVRRSACRSIFLWFWDLASIDAIRRRIEVFDKPPDAYGFIPFSFRGAGILVAPAMARMYAAK
jgi:hypothetical protein